ncbi:MAG: hypothetical protein MSC30_17060 [Gaiellaceae bacterium MAG52_C11]|nr:hypothetical protein [Candidatus Gaiellasilicea maunaloa]
MARKPPAFDPFGALQALDRHRVTYITIGGFARVIQGTEEVTRGLDIVPSTRPENLRRLDAALREIGAERADGKGLALEDAVAGQPTIDLITDHGEVKIVPTPAGTRGYDDLRRAANREPLGRGVRPSVASIGDLARMISALGNEQQLGELRQLRRLVELERGRTRAIER